MLLLHPFRQPAVHASPTCNHPAPPCGPSSSHVHPTFLSWIPRQHEARSADPSAQLCRLLSGFLKSGIQKFCCGNCACPQTSASNRTHTPGCGMCGPPQLPCGHSTAHLPHLDILLPLPELRQPRGSIPVVPHLVPSDLFFMLQSECFL